MRGRPGLAHLRAAYRSGLEATVAAMLATQGCAASFETHRVPFTEPAKNRHYTPDFVLPNGIVIETKGIFDAADRTKHLLVREQHPDLDIRIVFSNPNARISKGSPTTYAIWCGKNAFKFAKKEVPKEWVDEPMESVRVAAVAAFRKK